MNQNLKDQQHLTISKIIFGNSQFRHFLYFNHRQDIHILNIKYLGLEGEIQLFSNKIKRQMALIKFYDQSDMEKGLTQYKQQKVYIVILIYYILDLNIQIKVFKMIFQIEEFMIEFIMKENFGIQHKQYFLIYIQRILELSQMVQLNYQNYFAQLINKMHIKKSLHQEKLNIYLLNDYMYQKIKVKMIEKNILLKNKMHLLYVLSS
ncbi:unnamed protein product [Paramecium sonneborni]|uniref:Uncharacterized protein n=1 Tax=Paramecium sonneborni TaxID=65129 RepID=A0A8S1QF86_9CILI|nr:unnamed protein product [Paramecium sonneborni]